MRSCCHSEKSIVLLLGRLVRIAVNVWACDSHGPSESANESVSPVLESGPGVVVI